MREAAARAQCSNNLKQMALATHNFHDQLKQMPPLLGTFNQPPAVPGQPNNPPWGNVHFYILPFIEQDTFYKATYDPNVDGNNSSNGYRPWNNRWKPMKSYICPSDPSIPANGTGSNIYVGGWADSPSLASYASNAQVFGQVNGGGQLINWAGSARLLASFSDGASNTILFAEKYGTCGYYQGSTGYPSGSGGSVWNWWGYDSAQPAFAIYSIGPGSMFQLQPSRTRPTVTSSVPPPAHTGGMQVALGDATVRTVSTGISGTTWWAACTPAAGDLPGSDW